MDLQAFFMENVKPFREEVFPLPERFSQNGEPACFRLKGISEEKNAAIRKQCRKGDMGEIDAEEYLTRLAAACVMEPDLNNAALQRSWGVMGADALLRRMLAAGEFAALLERAQAVCGFDVPVREMADEIKKEPCRAMPNSITPTTPCMN